MKNLTAALAVLILASLVSGCGSFTHATGLSLDPHKLTADIVQKKLAEAELAEPMADNGGDARGAQSWSDIATWLRLYPTYDAPAACGFCQVEHLRLFNLWLASPERADADAGFTILFTDKGSFLGWLLSGPGGLQ